MIDPPVEERSVLQLREDDIDYLTDNVWEELCAVVYERKFNVTPVIDARLKAEIRFKIAEAFIRGEVGRAISVDEVAGVLGPDWTGGAGSVDWVRRQRDE